MATRKRKSAPKTHRDPVDEHAATELVMYIENTSDLSPDGPSGQGRSILLNMLRKRKRGVYDSTLAVRQFEWLTESGAKRYAKEFDSEKNWSKMFNPATRHEAAKQLEASFRSSVEHGEYDHVDTRIGGPREVDEHFINWVAVGKTRIDRLRADLPPGYDVYTYSPGDGVTRYRFFKNASPKQDYFGPDNGIYTALGYKEAEAFAQGLVSENVGESRRRKRPPERPAEVRARRSDDRPISMSYGELPDYNQFKRDIHTRIDPEKDGKTPYWPHGNYMYPMELVGAHEIELAEEFGGLNEFETERARTGQNSRARGFKGDEAGIYDFLRFLKEKWDEGDDEAGDLASSIMTTLGYEWI